MTSASAQFRIPAPIPFPRFLVMSTSRRFTVSLTIGALVFAAGGLLDWLVGRQYLPPASLMLGGVGIALAVAVLVFLALTEVWQRYQMMIERLDRVAELNHHIRNALQVILYHNTLNRSEEAIDQVNAEINRIELALRDVS